ncbi:MAG: HEAT repeat domain-containing protein [Ignavibacteriales bacterium]|nr:HEAT repeat domain-containing protein [Ignavibacteriales bacterium]
MKTLGTIFVALLLAVVSQTNAQDAKKDMGDAKFTKAVENYLVGLQSPNDGLRRSAIYQLGQLAAKDAAIPLMRVLRNCKDEKCRIAAAWALCKIGNSAGTYAVKQAVRFDESKKVQLHSAWYYNLYVSQGTFAFIPAASGTTTIAELR